MLKGAISLTIYLMVKTHQKTGLKYLCTTTKNPFTYNGSGIDWCNHLRKYGYEHNTEIVMECANQTELYYWGSYYSKLWNVVKGQDDYGNKIWANRIPETGGGGGVCGSNNPMKNPIIAAKISGEKHHMKKESSRNRMSINNPMHCAKTKKKLSTTLIAKGDSHQSKTPNSIAKRSGLTHYTYTDTIYCWQNVITHEIIYLTRRDFMLKVNGNKSHISSLLNGTANSHRGWKLVK